MIYPFSSSSSEHQISLHCSPQTTLINTRSYGATTIAGLLDKCSALKDGFKPSWWLPNGHAQTAYCVMGDFSQIDHVKYQRKYLRLPDGGTLGLDFTPSFGNDIDPATPIIVVEHGLTGGSHEAYVRHILATACAPISEGGLGYRGVVINFRGCAGVPITSPRFYSAACSDDYACGVLYISKLFPNAKLVGLGFSLGANVVTRYLGEEGEMSRVSGGCVLACPWNLVANSERLEGVWLNRTIYSGAMGNNVLTLYKSHLDSLKKFEGTHSHKLIPKVLALKSPKLIEVDDVVVSQSGGGAPHWPFKNAMGYYEHASSHRSLPGIKVPFLAINAEDDPIVRIIPRPDEPGISASGWVAVAVSKYGGHLGWFEDGDLSLQVKKWIKKPVLQWMQLIVDEFVRDPNQKGRDTEVVDGFTREIGRSNIGYKEVYEKDLPRGPHVEGLTTGL